MRAGLISILVFTRYIRRLCPICGASPALRLFPVHAHLPRARPHTRARPSRGAAPDYFPIRSSGRPTPFSIYRDAPRCRCPLRAICAAAACRLSRLRCNPFSPGFFRRRQIVRSRAADSFRQETRAAAAPRRKLRFLPRPRALLIDCRAARLAYTRCRRR